MADVQSGQAAGAVQIPDHEIQVTVVSADQEIWTGFARQVIARTSVGQIGILADGEVRVTTSSGEVIAARADDGFLSFDHNRLTVVARDAALV